MAFKHAAGKWAQKSVARMKEKGTVGSLTSAAHRAGYGSALEYAHHEKSDPNASGKMKKKANWAINMNS